jgi:hypothetical protein
MVCFPNIEGFTSSELFFYTAKGAFYLPAGFGNESVKKFLAATYQALAVSHVH